MTATAKICPLLAAKFVWQGSLGAGFLFARMNQLPSLEYVKECLDYDPITGIIRWKERPFRHFKNSRNHRRVNKRFAHKIAGGPDLCGYLAICLNYTAYRNHRLAWLLFTGEWPIGNIDHINGIATDNRIANLRLATVSENSRNTKLSVRNTSGIKGVIWIESRKKWRTQITINNKVIYLGYFSDKQSALNVIKAAREKYHGEFCNHG